MIYINIAIACATMLAAIFAAWSGFSARNALRSQLLNTMLDMRHSSDMLFARKMIYDWKRKYKNKEEDPWKTFIKVRDQGVGKELDSKRRYLKTYYQRVHLLWRHRLISPKIVVAVIDEQETDPFFDIFYPLEVAVARDVFRLDHEDEESYEQIKEEDIIENDPLFRFYRVLK
jgi:hypothetical protein